jgi:tetratricopeptide (TPR) repeat protein
LPYFERAIGLDSMLVPAYLYAAVVHSNNNRWDSAEVVTQRVARFRDRFTPFEQAMFGWAEANLSGSDERQLTSAQDVVARDSLPGFLYLIGLHANALLKPQVALNALLASDSVMVAVGWWQQVTVLAGAYHGLGRHEEELAMLRRRRRQFPSSTTIPGRELRALGALGHKEEALALTDTLLRGITNYTGDGIVAAIAGGALEFDGHHGDTATAREMSRRIVQWFRSKPNANPGPGRLAQEGRAFLQLGELDSAEAVFRRWAGRGGNDVAPHGHLGLVLALKGDSARARAIADSLGTVKRKWLFGLHTHWRAAILGAMGEREAALRLLQQSLVEGQNRSGLHTSLQFRSLRGYPPFEALAQPER